MVASPTQPSRTDSKARLLFVHGLGGRGHSAWGKFPEFLMADREMAERFSVELLFVPNVSISFSILCTLTQNSGTRSRSSDPD
jgi:hypothetical protein